MLQSFELQRVLEGEKAERTETARLLQDAKRRLATTPPGRQAEGLVAKSAALQEKLREQSAQAIRPFGCMLKKTAIVRGVGGGGLKGNVRYMSQKMQSGIRMH